MARHTPFDDWPRPARLLLGNKAEQLADRFAIEPDPIRHGLQALAEGIDTDLVSNPDEFPGLLRGFPFTLIADILESFPPPEAVRIIQEEDLLRLATKVKLVEYLSDVEVPFLTLPELAAHTKAFADYLREHKDYMVQTGLPPRVFRPCRWLYIQLGRLYDTRLTGSPYPHDELFSCSRRTPEPQPYDWLKTSASRLIECSYGEADILRGIAAEDVRRIEWGRDRFFQTKLHVVDMLQAALDQGRAEHLLQTCLAEVKKQLTREAIDFYCRLDQFYLGSSAIDDMDDRPSPKLSPGGLANLLRVIGHVEAEIRIGNLCRTADELPPAVVQAIRQQAEPLDEEHLYEADNCRWLYFRLMKRPERAAMDAALDGMLKRAKWAIAFWQDYQSRVRDSLQPQTPVPVLIQVDPRFANLIPPLLQYHAEILTEKFAKGEILVPPVLRGPVFRMVGGSWEIRYGDGELFPMVDAVGLHYIAHLLEHPGQGFRVDELRAIQTARMTGGSVRTKRGAEQAAETRSSSGQAARGDEVASRESIKQIHARYAELQDAIEEARTLNDESAVVRLEEERERLRHSLLDDLRPDGKSRLISDHKKIRNAVRKSIVESMMKIGKKDKGLGLHLQSSIKLADLFCYEPENSVPWNQ